MQDNATMVEGTPEINGYNIFKEQQSSSTNNTEVVRSRRNHYGQRENKFNRIYKKIFTLLKAKPVTPLTMITYCSEFQSDMELLDPSNDKKITASLLKFGNYINGMSLRELYNLFEEGEPIFDTSKLYYDLETSVEILNNLLIFYFDNDETEISMFLEDIVKIFDKRQPKLNTMCIYGPPVS